MPPSMPEALCSYTSQHNIYAKCSDFSGCGPMKTLSVCACRRAAFAVVSPRRSSHRRSWGSRGGWSRLFFLQQRAGYVYICPAACPTHPFIHNTPINTCNALRKTLNLRSASAITQCDIQGIFFRHNNAGMLLKGAVIQWPPLILPFHTVKK